MPNDSKPEPKRERGRPPTWEYPDRIDASPEEVAEVVLRAKPKKEWRFEEEGGRYKRRNSQ